MALRNFFTKIGDMTLAENGLISLDIPRKDFLRELYLRLTLVVTITTAGPGATFLRAPAEFLKNIQLIGDGKDVIKSISGRALMMKNYFQYGVFPRYTKPAVTGTMTMYLNLVLPLAMPRAVREIDTLLPTGKYTMLQLRVLCGTYLSIFGTAPTTAAFTSGNLEVLAHWGLNVQKKPYVFSMYKEGYIEKLVAGTTAGLQVDLPIGNVYRGFLIESEADGEDVSTINTGLIQLFSGSTLFGSFPYYTFKDDICVKQGALETPPAGYDAGWIYLDLCPEGRLVDAIDSSKISDLHFLMDVTHIGTTDYLRVFPDELITPR